MNRFLLATTLLGASAAAFAADDVARVISSTPVNQQVGVPRTACATYANPGVAPQCSTQTIFESRTVGYNVIYEFGGKQYSVQMPQNPGPTLRLQAVGTPVPVPAPMAAPASPAAAPMAMNNVQNEIVEDPAMMSHPFPAPVQVTYGYPQTVSYYGSPYYEPYYASWGPAITLGIVGGYFGGRYYGGRGYGGRGYGGWHGGRGYGGGHRR